MSASVHCTAEHSTQHLLCFHNLLRRLNAATPCDFTRCISREAAYKEREDGKRERENIPRTSAVYKAPSLVFILTGAMRPAAHKCYTTVTGRHAEQRGKLRFMLTDFHN